MEFNKNFKYTLILLLLLFGAILLITLPSDYKVDYKNASTSSYLDDDIVKNTISTSANWPLDFIYINGNWSDAVNEEWCDIINGIYVIENVSINAANSPIDAGVKIENSDEYFIIKNCSIYNGNDYGIYLNNTHNGILHNNTISDNYLNGVYATDSNNLTITDNIVNNNNNGIYFDSCNNNTISGNIVNDNGFMGIGILLSGCINNTISDNTVYNNYYDGICITLTKNITINDNIIYNNYHDGISLANSEWSLVLNNTLVDNTLFIGENCYSIDLLKNTMTGCGLLLTDLYLFYLNSIYIDNTNRVNGKPIDSKNGETDVAPIEDPGQIILVDCSDSVLSNLDISDCSAGFALYYCSNITIDDNIANNNEYYGMYSYKCNNITISNNDFSNNNEYINEATGIFLEECNNNTILGNDLYYNSYGIKLEHSHNNTLIDNILQFNLLGIRMLNSDNNSISNNIVNNNYNDGIDLYYCLNNTIVSNTINHNKYSGIVLYSSNFTIIKNNVIHCNENCWFQDNNCEGNVFINNDCGCPSGDDDDDDDDDDEEPPSIPSFPLYLFIGIIWISIFLLLGRNKVKRTYKFK